ncbi:hypothetical protein KV557_37615, partial [Kitasatospora aureofaciens]|nr:hypothetical protein [Kitasatospora aureofaciens]
FGRGAGSAADGLVLVIRGELLLGPSQANPTKRDVSPKADREGLLPVVLGLHTGCCPDPPPEPDGNPGRHLIRGREFKTARDEDGNHLSRGTERALPWVAIAPVVNAIRVLERMVPEGHLLFDSRTHHFATVRPATGSLVAGAMVRRIEDFITWANTEAARHGLAREAIPPDPHGRVASARFRRTLACARLVTDHHGRLGEHQRLSPRKVKIPRTTLVAMANALAAWTMQPAMFLPALRASHPPRRAAMTPIKSAMHTNATAISMLLFIRPLLVLSA